MRILLLPTACLALSFASLNAEPLAKWDFGGQDGAQETTSPVPGSTAKGLRASPIRRGQGFQKGNPTLFTENSMTFWMIPGINTVEDAVAKNAYFEVILTPEAGTSFSIQSVTFLTKRASKMSGPNKFVIRSSLDDFGTDISGPDETQPEPVPEGGDIAVSLGGSLDNLTQPVTLRFYGFGRNKADNADGGIWSIANSSIAGGFAIEGIATAKP